MKRTFTDPRFPAYEVVNDGDTVFHVVVNGRATDQFTSSEDIAKDTVSDAFAQRQAKEYFDYLATKTNEDDWQQDFGGGGGGTALAEPGPKKDKKLGVKREPGDDTEAVNVPVCPVCKGTKKRRMHSGKTVECTRCGGTGKAVALKSLNDILPDSELMTQDMIDKLIAAERAERDPKRKAQLRSQAMAAMQQMESLARQLARVLLS